jgi:hypothetical protein
MASFRSLVQSWTNGLFIFMLFMVNYVPFSY